MRHVKVKGGGVSRLEKIVNSTAVVLLLLLVGVFFVSMYKSTQLKKKEKLAYSVAGNAEMRAIVLKVESLQEDIQAIKKKLTLKEIPPKGPIGLGRE